MMLRLPCDEAVASLTQTLCEAGLRTVASFDSDDVRTEETAVSPSCPHHAGSICDCRLVVLLVYGDDGIPATLLAHGQDGETWMTMTTRAEQPQSVLEKKIVHAIAL